MHDKLLHAVTRVADSRMSMTNPRSFLISLMTTFGMENEVSAWWPLQIMEGKSLTAETTKSNINNDFIGA